MLIPILLMIFEQALLDRLDVTRLRLVDGAAHVAGLDEGTDGVEGDVGMHRGGAEADEDGELVHLTHLGRLGDEARLHSDPLANQVLMNGADREQDGDGDVIRIHAAIAEHEDVEALVDGATRVETEPLDGAFETPSALVGRVEERQRRGLEDALVHAADFGQLGAGEHRALDGEAVAILGRLVEGVASSADARSQGHHQRLADRIDGRVGDLREQLVEVLEEGRRPGAQHGEGSVVAHRSEGLGA